MRDYEFTVILVADEDKTKAGMESVTTAFATAGVEIAKQEDMGVKYLAYEIKKQDKGHYVYFELKADPASIVGFEQDFRLNANILKYLFVNAEN